MIMNGIKLVLLFLQVLHIHCSVEELRSLNNCGWTPFYPTPQIAGGYIIEPDEFSWIASLEYESRRNGYCAGSVISSLYVLTAAHCVTGQQVQNYGGLTGVRLGNFTQEPYCDYGTSNCTSYLRFGIANIKVHENYGRDINHTIRNDIALLRLDKPIIFGRHMKRAYLPFNTAEPTVNTLLTVAGWGLTMRDAEPKAKRAVDMPLLDKSKCEHQDESLMCAAKLADTDSESKKTCEGDSGGPLMHAVNPRQTVIEGIVSYGQSRCGNRFFPSHFTRIRHYLNWMEENVCTGIDCTTVAELKFPTDCGYPTTDGHHSIRPEDYSWLAGVMYENRLLCPGSVINSRYVLTTWSRKLADKIGPLIRVRLGDYDDNGHMCDYGTKNCTHYQQFGIEKIIPHKGFIIKNIALMRLDRSIQFGPKMKPICLPFGIYDKPEPPVDSSLTVTGWSYNKGGSVRKSDQNVTLCECFFSVNEKHICTTNLCIGDYGSPLMYYQSDSQRMVLEGIVDSRPYRNCTPTEMHSYYIRVRSYRDWLNENMEI